MTMQQNANKENMPVQTRNALLITIGLAVIVALALLQELVILSYDTTLTQAGIPLSSLDYPSVVVIFVGAWALGLSARQFWKLHKLKG